MDKDQLLTLLAGGINQKKKVIDLYEGISNQSIRGSVKEIVDETLVSEHQHLELLNSLVKTISGSKEMAREKLDLNMEEDLKTREDIQAAENYLKSAEKEKNDVSSLEMAFTDHIARPTRDNYSNISEKYTQLQEANQIQGVVLSILEELSRQQEQLRNIKATISDVTALWPGTSGIIESQKKIEQMNTGIEELRRIVENIFKNQQALGTCILNSPINYTRIEEPKGWQKYNVSPVETKSPRIRYKKAYGVRLS